MSFLKKLFFVFLLVVAFSYLSQKNLIPTMNQIKSLLNLNESHGIAHQEKSTQTIADESKPLLSGKYQMKEIQTYRVSVENGQLIVTGHPTPYGKHNQASGVILYIQEVRADKKTTIKVPFSNGEIKYAYPLSYQLGDVVINLDEFYNGKENDPNKVLGFAQYHLTDSDPYLTPSYMIQSDNPALKALAENITSGKESETEKSMAIFKWVAKNVTYNVPLINAVDPPIYSALQTYQSRVVLCSGYADLSAALHRAEGIPAKVAYGENHAWNEVLLNGVWQSEDPTFGSGYINISTNKFVPSYQAVYFSKTDKHKEGEYPW